MRPETRDLYPDDWPAISRAIRFGRAGGRCECDGRCGSLLCPPRCVNVHGEPSVYNGKVIVLTTAHLDGDPTNCADANLLALCAPCHLRYDAAQHADTRRARSASPGDALLW